MKSSSFLKVRELQPWIYWAMTFQPSGSLRASIAGRLSLRIQTITQFTQSLVAASTRPFWAGFCGFLHPMVNKTARLLAGRYLWPSLARELKTLDAGLALKPMRAAVKSSS